MPPFLNELGLKRIYRLSLLPPPTPLQQPLVPPQNATVADTSAAAANATVADGSAANATNSGLTAPSPADSIDGGVAAGDAAATASAAERLPMPLLRL